jgi:hypothetical protein
MCGISGQLNFEPEQAVAPEILERMRDYRPLREWQAAHVQ